jgi:hypothetical protein
MDFNLVDTWVRLATILVGLASCFYGYPLFRIFLVVSGLFYGYLYGQSFYAASHPMMAILMGVGAAVVLGLLAYPLWSLGVIAVGAALGFMIFGELGLILNLPEAGVILLGFLGAALAGFLFFRARDLFVMVATAFNGAVQVIYGLGIFHAALAIGLGRSNFLAMAAILILGSLGLAAQYAMFKDRREYSL